MTQYKKPTSEEEFQKNFTAYDLRNVIKLGVLDGFYGFVISFALSYGVLVRYIKLWNLKQHHRKTGKAND